MALIVSLMSKPIDRELVRYARIFVLRACVVNTLCVCVACGFRSRREIRKDVGRRKVKRAPRVRDHNLTP
jgi:hypothetical protein